MWPGFVEFVSNDSLFGLFREIFRAVTQYVLQELSLANRREIWFLVNFWVVSCKEKNCLEFRRLRSISENTSAASETRRRAVDWVTLHSDHPKRWYWSVLTSCSQRRELERILGLLNRSLSIHKPYYWRTIDCRAVLNFVTCPFILLYEAPTVCRISAVPLFFKACKWYWLVKQTQKLNDSWTMDMNLNRRQVSLKFSKSWHFTPCRQKKILPDTESGS